jgi:DNA-binding PadR family transcriptional regulator
LILKDAPKIQQLRQPRQASSIFLTITGHYVTIDTVMNDLVVLAMLADGPKHGYQLKREAGFILGQGDMHNNLVYPLLRRFTGASWVTKKAVAGERGQTRQMYALTAAGKKELISRLSTYDQADANNARGFIARVGMFELLPLETRTEIMDRRQAFLSARQQRLKAMSENLELGVFGAEVVGHVSALTRSELAWIRRLRRIKPEEKHH